MKQWLYTILVIISLAGLMAGCPSTPEELVGSSDGSGGQTTTGGGIPTATQPAAIQGPAFTISLLDPLYEATAGAKAVALGDIDNDGVMDAVSISDANQPVQLHLRNTTTGLFETIAIAGGAPIAKMIDVELEDFNNDGLLDIALLINDTGYAPPSGVNKIGAVVLLIQGADPRDPVLWTRVVVDMPENDEAGLTDMAVTDIDGDGHIDLVVLSNQKAPQPNEADSFVFVYFNPGGVNALDDLQWFKFVLARDVANYAGVDTADIDEDGDPDVVTGVPQAKSYNVRWHQNPLIEAGLAAVTADDWTARIVGQQEGGADLISLGDIDNDGHIDVATAHAVDGLVQWFRNPGPVALNAERFPIPWSVFNIGYVTRAGEINQLQLVDLDSDGLLQVFVAAGGEAWGFLRQDDIEKYWVPFLIFNTNPIAEIGRLGFDDFNADGQLDFIVPLDREGLTEDTFLIFARQ